MVAEITGTEMTDNGFGYPTVFRSGLANLTVIERSVNNVMVADRLTDAGLDPEAVRELTRRVGLKTLKLGKGGEETSDQGQSFILAYIFNGGPQMNPPYPVPGPDPTADDIGCEQSLEL